jgi:hypothetical protein
MRAGVDAGIEPPGVSRSTALRMKIEGIRKWSKGEMTQLAAGM